MSKIQELLKEMDQEAITTRKMLERVPNDKFDWQPHIKSMNVRKLASHIAELPGWVSMVLNTRELDFAANPYTLPELNSTQQLLDFYEKNLADGRTQLAASTEKDLEPEWTLRNGDMIFTRSTRAEFIRVTYCQIVHHRAQLGVYLRLLNVPIPGSYGPSADDISF